MKYLLMSKFSQNKLELFFGAIRSAGGFNNNTTTKQFTLAYKRLLMRSTIQGGQGNCELLDPTEIFHALDDTCKVNNEAMSISNALMIRKYDLMERKPDSYDHDYCDAPTIIHLSEYKKAFISYIGGYVAQMVQKQISCMSCSQDLGSRGHQAERIFLKMVGRGSLFKPTLNVLKVCEKTEKYFQRMLNSNNKIFHMVKV